MMDKLKRVVIKEELVAITGDFALAVVLDRFLCLGKRDKWIPKKASELVEETMLGVSKKCMRRYIKALIDKNYITERNNPDYKWDKTKQYRVNFEEIQWAVAEKINPFDRRHGEDLICKKTN